MEKYPLHLKTPELQQSEEVEAAVEKQERLDGEKVPNDPAARIEAYMDRLENIFLNSDERIRERNLDMMRDQVYDKLIIKRENFPESYFDLQKRIARERGQAVEEIPQDVREQMMDVAIEDQKHSLDAWMDYLTSDDAVYPPWFKYYVWNQVIKLSQFDKERSEYKTRTDTTVAPFPDIYRESLAQISDLYESYPKLQKEIEPKLQQLRAKRNTLKKSLKSTGDDKKKSIEDEMAVIEAEMVHVEAPLKDFNKKFPNLYAELTSESLVASMESREEIHGEWIKYGQGHRGDAEKLFQSLKGKGTGWCTAGRSTAETQIQSGDFYVYYSNDAGGEPTQPRLAIRMDGDQRIGEVRGVLPNQNVEPLMQDILSSKLNEFGQEADIYQKKSEDMKRLTVLEQKQEKSETFTRDDLIFLYEIDSKIEGFGYRIDPRIEELRLQRVAEEDAPIVLDCAPSEIAWKQEDITVETKSYIGPLFTGVFSRNLEHIYTSFPEGKLENYHIELGGKTKDEYTKELQEQNVWVSDWAEDLLKSKDFITSKKIEGTDLVRLAVEDLGFHNGATTDQIYAKAKEFGLELCPAEVGPALRLVYSGGDYMWIAMKQISDRDGNPSIFCLNRHGARLELRASVAESSSKGLADYHFVFRLRK